MAANLWESSLINYWSSSLASGIASNATIIVIGSPASGVTAPGVIVINREDSPGNKTPTLREWISFSTISGQNLSGLTRGLGGSTAKAHSAGSVIQAGITSTHWTDLVDYLQAEHDALGKHVIGTATVNYVETPRLAVTSTATIASAYISSFEFGYGQISTVTITQSINASGASIVGFPQPDPGGMHPLMIAGSVVAGTNLTPLMIIENSTTLKSISAMLKSPVSASSLVLDVNKNFSTLFTDQNTRLSILAGGTFASTASVGDKTLVPGNLLSLDIDNSAGGGAGLTVILES